MLKVTDLKYWMHPTLKTNLDSLVYNTKDDWQFMIIISGDSRTRIGKTMIGVQIGYYLSYYLKRKFSLNNIVFSGKELMDKAKKLSPSIFILDESRADLASIRYYREMTQILIDFFNETGMLNNIIILIIPDFFDLPKTIAIGHSEFLINVFVKREIKKNNEGDEIQAFTRGYFGFYGYTKKKKLYNAGKKYNDYNAESWDFWGEFKRFDIVNQEEYYKKKLDYIKRDRELDMVSGRGLIFKAQRDFLIEYLFNKGMTQREISSIIPPSIGLDQTSVSYILRTMRKS